MGKTESGAGSGPGQNRGPANRRRDAGDETARNYRYQHSYGVMLLAAACRGDRPYSAIWCEYHDDILAERDDGKFEAWQVKTRRSEAGPWTLGNADFLGSLKRFAALDALLGDRIERFYFASNTAFAEAEADAAALRVKRSPIALLKAVRDCASLRDLALPFAELVDTVAEYCGATPGKMFGTLARTDLVRGPSRGEIDASLSNEHLARIEIHARRSVAEVARASSLHVTDPARHLRAVVDSGTLDPALLAKRVPKEAVLAILPRQAAEAEADELAGLHHKFDALAEQLSAAGVIGGLNRDQVAALLQAFDEVNVDVSDAMDLLLRKAEEFRRLQDEIAERMASDMGDDARFARVFQAFQAGDLDAADVALEQLAQADGPAREGVLIETMRLYVMRAGLALTRLKYDDAAEHFGTAATITGIFDKARSFELFGEQARVYVDKALLHGGRPAFDRAFDICQRRIDMAPENSEQRFRAIGQLVSYLGVASERAPAPEAEAMVAVALRIGQPVLDSLDPDRHPDIWIPLANTLGAVLNNAARLATDGDEARSIAYEARDNLVRATRIARAANHAELSNLESNLATAFRRTSQYSSKPSRDLKRSIIHRVRALRVHDELNDDQLGNALDSLGNDYSALAEVGPELNRRAFRRALAAYRAALPCRPKEVAPINWGRTQFNIGNNYARACTMSNGATARRYGLAALARFEMALSVLTPRNAPHDWAYSCFQMTLVIGRMIDRDCGPGIARIEAAMTMLADVGDVGDGTGDLGLVAKAIDMQAYFARHLFADRGKHAPDIIEGALARLRPRLEIYRYTPLRLMFALTEAQFSFMLGHLTGNRAGVDAAIATVETCTAVPATENEAGFVELAREVLIDMREMRERMSGNPP